MAEKGSLSSAHLGEIAKSVSAFHDFVEEAPHRINVMCFAGGAAIVLNGFLGVLDVFDAFDDTIYYVVNAYMVFFGIVTCVTESHSGLSPELHEKFASTQEWMHEWAKGLTMLWGRGLFYVFQGTLCILSSSNLSLGVLIGAYLMVMGAVCINLHFRRRKEVPDDYIRITE
eukprot:TRINITY_DN81540_c0_g1_i1.p1 TRINITY_DN81540_c0_g1~~TRINITY_DN81540_c0_g1_i1.p1  ORF type:complete len:171 (+),score=32.70 TRINITY_DN81540_c0_g1_i1:58-570(+)